MRIAMMIAAIAACAHDEAPIVVPPPAALALPHVGKTDAAIPLAKLSTAPRTVRLGPTGELFVSSPDASGETAIASLDALAGVLPAMAPTAPDPWATTHGPVPAARGFERAPAALGSRDVPATAPLVIADPRTPAAAVTGVAMRFGARLGVATRERQRGVLRLAFAPASHGPGLDDEAQPRWIELYVGAGGIDVLSMPTNGRAHVAWTANTAGDLRAIYRGLGAVAPGVDVFTADGATAQQLIDTLVALDEAGVTALGLAPEPGPIDGRMAQVAALRDARTGYTSPTAVLRVGVPYAQGDLDKRVIRSAVLEHREALGACYEAGLAKSPELRGIVQSQFFIGPDGAVVVSNASGVDPAVSSCIAGAIKTFAFPKPRGGGGVQVNFPFTLRPARA